MKKVLLDSTRNWYKANLHGHSTESDGILTPEKVKKAYKEQGVFGSSSYRPRASY